MSGIRGPLLCCLFACLLPAARAQTVTVEVSAPRRDYRDATISIVAPASLLAERHARRPVGTTPLTCQVEEAGGKNVRLTFVVPELKKGEKRRYALTPGTAMPTSGVTLTRKAGNVDFVVNGKLFTRYDTTTGPNKPYFYPVNAPTGAQIVRHWPVETVGTETHDHPHHRGLWFTHAKVNNVDFWTEAAGKTGRTVNTGFDAVESGPVFGRMRTRTDWIMPDGKKIAEDTRDIRVYTVADGTLMDFAVTVKAVGGPMVWGDDKDGILGLRVADTMRVDAGKNGGVGGHIENASGVTDAAAWGKPADWCDYYGPLDGQTVGVAILDDPANLRHPTPWHVRTYGLFAANPFGLHDFDPAKKNDAHAGDYTLPEGKSLTFRYRLFFHRGDTKSANVPAVWASYADPPDTRLLDKGAVP